MKKFVLKKDETHRRSASYRIPYKKQLNEAQYKAVMHDRGPALVVAGAGTGKTRTLIYRVARLIEEGIAPESVLLLTFTRRAAREMLDRASAMLDERCSRVRGGTFHFYCNQILHRYAENIGYPAAFTLLDQADSMDTIQHIRSGFLQQFKRKRFPQKQALQAIISTSINKQIPLYETVAEEYPQFLEHHEAIEEIARKYDRYKSENGVMDFDDLLVQTRRLLCSEPEIREKVAARNRYVMVDEYQDTNALQAELVSLFSSVHNNLMVVGDDAQSIYSFRGADFKNILAFPSHYEESAVIKLEQNFRSRKPVLDLANTLLDKASEKYEKTLYTLKEEGDLPGLVKASTERDQSRFIAQMLLQLREQGISLGDIGVLFRNGRDSYDLEWELNKKNIPFQKFGGQKFAEAAHVRDVLAHLRVVVNPDDRIAWNRVLLLLEGIGPKTAGELITWLHLNNSRDPGEADLASKSYKKQLDGLSSVLSRIRTMTQQPGKAVSELVAYYQPLCEKKFDDHPKRLKDLKAFAGLAENFPTIEKILQDLTLDPLDATAVETEKSTKDESPLVLSTIHSAKGLEWDTVFIIQCLDGIIPSGYAVDNASALDEELRLLYVACTRARERLFITYPVTRESGYGDFFTNPSRFVNRIPEKILEPWYLQEEGPQNQLDEKGEGVHGSSIEVDEERRVERP